MRIVIECRPIDGCERRWSLQTWVRTYEGEELHLGDHILFARDDEWYLVTQTRVAEPIILENYRAPPTEFEPMTCWAVCKPWLEPHDESVRRQNVSEWKMLE